MKMPKNPSKPEQPETLQTRRAASPNVRTWMERAVIGLTLGLGILCAGDAKTDEPTAISSQTELDKAAAENNVIEVMGLLLKQLGYKYAGWFEADETAVECFIWKDLKNSKNSKYPKEAMRIAKEKIRKIFKEKKIKGKIVFGKPVYARMASGELVVVMKGEVEAEEEEPDVALSSRGGNGLGEAVSIESMGTRGVVGRAGKGYRKKVEARVVGRINSVPIREFHLDSRNQTEIKKKLKRRYTGIMRCYKEKLKLDPELRGKVVVRFWIHPDGKVVKTEVDKNTTGDSELAACICATVEAIRFGATDDGETEVVYPVILVPEG